MGFKEPEDRLTLILAWQERFTKTLPPEVFLQSWAIIELAQHQRWPERAIEIGKSLRNILSHLQIKTPSVTGLHALFWIRKRSNGEAISKLAVVNASVGD